MGSICVALIAMLIMTEFWTRAGPKVATWSEERESATHVKDVFLRQKKIEKLSVRVVKSDQTREPLDREKIRRGIERACSKRSIPSAIIERVVQDIETDIYTNYESEVTSAQVGDIVMRHLTDLDQVAYIRFASVYREFDDAQDFIQAISNIVGKRTKRV